MRSEPHLFQVSMDSPGAKNKPLKYFHSAFSPLPSAVYLRCSNNFKRRKQYLSLTTEYTHMCMHVHTQCEQHHCTSWTFPAPVSSDITFVPFSQLTSSSPVEILGGGSHWLPVFPEMGRQRTQVGDLLYGSAETGANRGWPPCTQIIITNNNSSYLLSTYLNSSHSAKNFKWMISFNIHNIQNGIPILQMSKLKTSNWPEVMQLVNCIYN